MNKYKIISFVFLISLTTLSVAQDNTEKKDFLPKAGDFSIGISLNPIINAVGVDPIVGSIGGQVIAPSGLINATLFPTASIIGKYMLTDKIAVRGNLGILVDRENDTRYVRDDKLFAADPLSQANVIDGSTIVRDGISLSLGGEYRIGKGRVQGIFGASVAYAYTMESWEYSYGNAITEANQMPTITGTTDATFSPAYYSNIIPAIPNARYLNSEEDKGAHAVGLIGHVGVECFVAPQISIGIEMSLSAFYSWSGEKYADFEGYNVLTNQVEVYTDLLSPKSTAFVFGTNSLSGNIVMNFYF